ncbi:Bax inhibitor-1/YccA family protein [Bacillus carboniphilus]|uniref:Bax inhibitor-1/YccA family protein n=1 Tax=Bacillus carboniphilus TaxID=86663 RepID=A0ABY9JTR2_9BACI|nr:Bax inhibitor-1/YccA family protein [Bacillus carboniphilus]WLR42747.1 Bax inhibitor-1/YccA family protein [Bacillus carboniphilus]
MHEQNLITQKVLPTFFMTLLVSFLGMVIGMLYVPAALASGIGVIIIVILIITAIIKRKSAGPFGFRIPLPFLFIFTFLMGLSIYPTVGYYLSTVGANVVLTAFGVTAFVFGSLFIYAYTTKRDFSFLGGMLFIGLISLIVLSIIGVFFIKSETFHLAMAWVGVLLFSGYVLYDVSMMKNHLVDEKDVPAAVLNLYIDFINLFLDILRIIASFVSKD